jgi:hypothetical protein
MPTYGGITWDGDAERALIRLHDDDRLRVGSVLLAPDDDDLEEDWSPQPGASGPSSGDDQEEVTDMVMRALRRGNPRVVALRGLPAPAPANLLPVSRLFDRSFAHLARRLFLCRMHSTSSGASRSLGAPGNAGKNAGFRRIGAANWPES